MTLVNMQERINASPYYSRYGLKVSRSAENGIMLELPFLDKVMGNPTIKAVHGGLLAMVLELAADLQASAFLNIKASPLNQTTSYLRRTNASPLFASARIIKAGRRFSVMEAIAWQENSDKPVATAVFTFQSQT